MYCRKVVIISGTDSNAKGVLTLVKEAEGVTAKCALFGLASHEIEYVLAIACEGRVWSKKFSARETAECRDVTELTLAPTSRIAAIVGVCASGKPIAYGSNTGVPMWESGLVSAIAPQREQSARTESEHEPCAEARGAEQTPPAAEERCGEESDGEEAQPSAAPPDPFETEAKRRAVYDDERIADYNYYPYKLEPRIDRGRYVAARECAAQTDAWGGYNAVYRPRLKVKKEQSAPSRPEYYFGVKATLDRLFLSAPREETLCDALAPSKWVRVDYREGLYYCVGLVGDGPEYIGYAVPGVFALNPPRQMEGICKWLPLKSSDPRGHGYWLMFQDAHTGASIRLREGNAV